LEGIGGVQIERTEGAGGSTGRAAGEDHEWNGVCIEGGGLSFEVAGRTVVEEAVVGTKDGPARAGRVIGKAKTRNDILIPKADTLANSISTLGVVAVRVERALGGQAFDVVANAVVEGDVRAYSPGVFEEGAKRSKRIPVPGDADALNEGLRYAETLCLDGREAGEAGELWADVGRIEGGEGVIARAVELALL